MSEIWTATEEKENMIIFEVKDEQTQKVRQEQRYKDAIPTMLILGGYPPPMGILMASQPLPWRFRKVGDNIYLDGPSIGVENYHPINTPV